MSAYWSDDRDHEWSDDEEDVYDDCGMGPDGYCSMAGSEECDFECPIMLEIYQAEAKRKAGTK